MADNDEIINGEVIDNDWFLSAINGNLDYLKQHTKTNIGKTGESNCTALMYSADMDRVDCVDFLSQFDDEICRQDINGNTALIYAVKKDNIECVSILAELECNIVNNDKKRAIDFAVELGFNECVEILSKFEILDDANNGADDGSDDSNSERNLIKENKRLRKDLSVVKSAVKEAERKIDVGKDRVV